MKRNAENAETKRDEIHGVSMHLTNALLNHVWIPN